MRGSASASPAMPTSGRQVEPVALGQPLDVTLVEELYVHLGVALAQPAQLAVLARHEALLHDRDLEVEVLLGEEEVRRECEQDAALGVLLEHERARLVVPGDAV